MSIKKQNMRIILSAFFFLLLFTVQAQDENMYQRTYMADDEFPINIAATQGEDGTFYVLDGLVEDLNSPDGLTWKSMVFTSFTKKGNVNWSREMVFDTDRSIELVNANLVINASDSLFFSLAVSDTTRNHKVIGAFDRGGRLGWMNSYGLVDTLDQTIFGDNSLALHQQGYLLNGTIVGNAADRTDLLSAINTSGESIWSRSVQGLTSEGVPVPIQMNHISATPDSNILIGGLNGISLQYYFAELDTNGNTIVAATVQDTVNLVPLYIANSVSKNMTDTTYMVSGVFINFNLFNPAASVNSGFIAKHDKEGQLIWSNVFDLGGLPSIPSNHVLKNDGSIVIAGEEAFNGVQFDHFMMEVDPDGRMSWGTQFPRAAGIFTSLGDLLPTVDGGYARFSTAIDQSGTQTLLNLIKTNNRGETSCQDSLVNSFMEPSFLRSEIFGVRSSLVDTVNVEPYPVVVENFDGYDTPEIPLAIDIFCPNEPILWTFDASMEGASGYEWNTGATTDTLQVTDDETYMVTVTFDENVCYTLCDSATLQRYDEPQVTLQQVLGDFCENGMVTINALYSGGAFAPKPDPTFTWSTGETGLSIMTDAWDQEITFTAVDGCGEVATASIVVGEPQLIMEVDIEENVSVLCEFVTGTLTATADAPINSVTWSTGETGLSISPTEIGTYTATILDICDNEFQTSVTYDFVPSDLSEIAIEEDVEVECDQVTGTLTAMGNGQIGTYLWSTGETNFEISPTTIGTYTVTVTDACFEREYVASVTYDFVPSTLTGIEIVEEDIVINCDSVNGGSLRVQGDAALDNIMWSNGETTESIMPEETGEYTVTATDVCNENEYSTFVILSPLESEVQFPKVFMPSASEATNQVFRGYNKCGGEVSDYVLKVFNRWGQEVFSTTDIDGDWDGTDGSSDGLYAADVYVWYAEYSDGNMLVSVKGDVTLIR